MLCFYENTKLLQNCCVFGFCPNVFQNASKLVMFLQVSCKINENAYVSGTHLLNDPKSGRRTTMDAWVARFYEVWGHKAYTSGLMAILGGLRTEFGCPQGLTCEGYAIFTTDCKGDDRGMYRLCRLWWRHMQIIGNHKTKFLPTGRLCKNASRRNHIKWDPFMC